MNKLVLFPNRTIALASCSHKKLTTEVRANVHHPFLFSLTFCLQNSSGTSSASLTQVSTLWSSLPAGRQGSFSHGFFTYACLKNRKGQSKLHSFRDGWRHLRFMMLHSPTAMLLVPGAFFWLLGLLISLSSSFISSGFIILSAIVFAFTRMTLTGCF